MARKLKTHEQLLIESILNAANKGEDSKPLHEYWVQDMKDGGMGSIKFISLTPESKRTLGSRIEAMTVDSCDGIEISISLNFDDEDRLYELDLWKVDFSPTKGYPTPDSLTDIRNIPAAY